MDYLRYEKTYKLIYRENISVEFGKVFHFFYNSS